MIEELSVVFVQIEENRSVNTTSSRFGHRCRQLCYACKWISQTPLNHALTSSQHHRPLLRLELRSCNVFDNGQFIAFAFVPFFKIDGHKSSSILYVSTALRSLRAFARRAYRRTFMGVSD